ncbi:MAG: hypothetical protein E7Z92_05950 [Cyanobacteria bacterium SIG31]|nr:hypothetical protein [Cyanobacteria bacterium SIG31]
MLIALTLFLMLFGLKKLGVNIPYYDNLRYFLKTKMSELKLNKVDMQKPIVKQLPINKPKPINPVKMHKQKFYKPFSGNLKI